MILLSYGIHAMGITWRSNGYHMAQYDYYASICCFDASAPVYYITFTGCVVDCKPRRETVVVLYLQSSVRGGLIFSLVAIMLCYGFQFSALFFSSYRTSGLRNSRLGFQ